MLNDNITEKEACNQAIFVQDACNLVAVARSFAEICLSLHRQGFVGDRLRTHLSNDNLEQSFMREQIEKFSHDVQLLLAYSQNLEEQIKRIQKINNQAGPGSRKEVNNLCDDIKTWRIDLEKRKEIKHGK